MPAIALMTLSGDYIWFYLPCERLFRVFFVLTSGKYLKKFAYMAKTNINVVRIPFPVVFIENKS